MNNYPDLNQFVDEALGEVLNGSSDITKSELRNDSHRYELQLTKTDGEDKTKLVLKKKGNGRPVPVVIVNAVTDEGRNLLHQDQRLDYSDKVLLCVKEALTAIVESLESS